MRENSRFFFFFFFSFFLSLGLFMAMRGEGGVPNAVRPPLCDRFLWQAGRQAGRVPHADMIGGLGLGVGRGRAGRVFSFVLMNDDLLFQPWGIPDLGEALLLCF